MKKIKVLWFEITSPSRMQDSKAPIAGWQDALEEIVRKSSEIELGIAYEGKKNENERKIDGVTYFPIYANYSFIEKIQNKYSWDIISKKLLTKAVEIVKHFQPDIIHVFGSEWCWGQITNYVDVPIVIHMQGSIPPYFNARFPPNYNIYDEYRYNGLNIIRSFNTYLNQIKLLLWKKQEEKTLRTVSNYMGRTSWDNNIIKLYNPNAKYFYCSEAIRPCFIDDTNIWIKPNNTKLQLITIGCSTYWKGLDTIIRTAKILKEYGVDFEWNVVGKMSLMKQIEYKEKEKFSNVNVKVHGFVDSLGLCQLLQKCNLYIHTAYIDNSPNSICEAQCIGIPIIATYVGGIPSLIEHGKEGILVPANDPYTLAMEIIKLNKNKELQQEFSTKGRQKAINRHSSSNIMHDLLSCYKTILNNSL